MTPPRARRPLPWIVPLAVVVLSVVPRLEPALRGFNFSNDAAEYLLLARSLADGRGFTLPIKVRFTDPHQPAVHEAYGERAPLYPLLLSLPVRLTERPGWPHPAIQLTGVALAALAALLATLLGADLARRSHLSGRNLAWAALLSGLAVAWQPDLVRASVTLWAEPLSLVLVLAAARHHLALAAGATPSPAGATPWWPRALALGLLLGAARFARPEAGVLVPVVLGIELARGRRRQAALAALAILAVNALGLWATGVVAPQLELLGVTDYTQLMTPPSLDAATASAAASAPAAADMLLGALANLLDQLAHMLTPRYGFLLLPLALLGARSAAARSLLLPAAGLVLATAAVWSTRDPSRFCIAPLALLAPVAAVELLRWRRRLVPRSRFAAALAVGLWAAVFAQRASQEAHHTAPPPPLEVEARADVPRLDDPWSYALLTGRAATLARTPDASPKRKRGP